jgi:hypothetical protein
MHRLAPRALLLSALLLVGCHATTTRPFFPPATGAAQAQIELGVQATTAEIADVLRTDSLPVRRVEVRDGLVETDWFDVTTKQRVTTRPVGPNVVQVRAWVDPYRTSFSRVTLETVYRPVADPSRADRDLEQQVPLDHPIAKRMTVILKEMASLYSRDSSATVP